MKVDFSEKIRLLREKQIMTQSDLGKKLGVSKAVISAYETGVNQPKHEVLRDMALLFNVTIDYLYGLDDGEIDRKKRTVTISGLNEPQMEQMIRMGKLLKTSHPRVKEFIEAAFMMQEYAEKFEKNGTFVDHLMTEINQKNEDAGNSDRIQKASK